ncbi:hypothetical protein D9M68_496650 [compost metagenome]
MQEQHGFVEQAFRGTDFLDQVLVDRAPELFPLQPGQRLRPVDDGGQAMQRVVAAQRVEQPAAGHVGQFEMGHQAVVALPGQALAGFAGIAGGIYPDGVAAEQIEQAVAFVLVAVDHQQRPFLPLGELGQAGQ